MPLTPPHEEPGETLLNRRRALRQLALFSAAPAVIAQLQAQAPDTAPTPPTPEETNFGLSTEGARPKGTPSDPDLFNKNPYWPLLFTAEEIATAKILADTILPASTDAPAASAVGTVEFINEWISSPYPDMMKDRPIIRGGLSWLNTEAFKRFEKTYVELKPAQQQAICDDICSLEKAAAPLKTAATFFHRFRSLTMAGYFTTPEGLKDLGYIGNVPSPTYAGPPREALAHLGLI
jgi:hypothetical protein